jgi:hypothetical protein
MHASATGVALFLAILSNGVAQTSPPCITELPKVDTALVLKERHAEDKPYSVTDVEIHENGSFHYGSYTRSLAELGAALDSWPKDEKTGAPAMTVWLVLYPDLRSNNDLKRVRTVVDVLNAKKLSWLIVIAGSETPVPAYLLSKRVKRVKR